MDFCFSTYVLELQSMCYAKDSQEDLVNLLFNYFVKLAELTLKNGEEFYLDKKQVSKLITRKVNIPTKIRKVLGKRNYEENGFQDFFKKNVYSKLIPNEVAVKSTRIFETLNSSSLVSDVIKQQLEDSIKEKDFSTFLAIALKLTLTSFPNKAPQLSDDEVNSKEETASKKIKTNTKIYVPEEIQAEEQPYISAIIDAISEKEKQSLTIENLKDIKKYEDKLTHHRTEYFSAEYVRRQSREIYDENDDPFDELQDELKDGIYYTINKEYENGYDRLNSSLEQAAQVQIESNPLVKETNLVNMKAKQGLCHTLINDKKLDGWTNDKYN